ncbi:MAG TPA: rhodanese-like domain-containing protein [Rhizomicrobium sp.]|nr:rhodanese-like domain-containing protein [Rhizomicrobium sp.]
MRTRRQFVSALCATTLLTPLGARAAATDSIPDAAQLQPAQLAEMLKHDDKLVILQVGFKTLYDQAHIVGAQYAGPGNKDDGLANLGSHVGKLAHDAPVVIYCGCCPWVRCPNMGAAWDQLHAQGFSNVKALYIVGNFGDDWVNKGYPVTRGE